MTKPLRSSDESVLPVPYAPVIIRLLKGTLFNDEREMWTLFVRNRQYIEQYFQQIGVEVYYSESDGYVYLTQPDLDDESLPRLVSRRALRYSITVVLVLIREAINQFDRNATGEPNLVISGEDLFQQMQPFYPKGNDERQILRTMQQDVKDVIDLGFLKLVGKDPARFLVRPSIKSRINSDVLAHLRSQLEDYAQRQHNNPNE